MAYSASVPGAEGSDAVIEVHAVPGCASQEADRVVELIGRKDIGSAAVLVRSRAHLIEIVNALKRHRIAFQAIEIDQLGERQVIEDLMALTFALLHAGGSCLMARNPARALVRPHARRSARSRRQRTIDATVWDLLHRNDIELT